MTQAAAPNMIPGDRESRDRALFDDIAERYTRKDLHRTSSVARRQRLRRTLAAAPLPARPAILDAGCGAGFSARYLEGQYGRYLGIDYADKLIECAKDHNTCPEAGFRAANLKDLDLNESFDAVVMIGVLHHLDDMPAVLDQLVRVLRPGGWLLANEPQPGNPLIRQARSMRKRMDGDYSDEQDELSARQFSALYRDAGLSEVSIIPQGLFSTPFAEVPMGPAWLTRPAAIAACWADSAIETLARPLLGRVSWNLIARGRKA